MQRTRQIAIILPDTLQCIGLQSVLIDYFHPVEVSCFSSFTAFTSEGYESFEYYFTNADLFVLNSEFFLPRKNKTIILVQDAAGEYPANYVPVSSSLEVLLEKLRDVFAGESLVNHLTDEGKDLSHREKDVLQLIVKGSTNKEIADKLNISLNTVLTHRKNITAKLGIKTVSGLTYYAIMNGFISADDIDV
ncbi:MAG: response regulator transcription factor [Tannerellaceae bacterium]|nr:response regulator transcription factor [Tannerellaceae bacterium]